ncbi:MAG: multidrug effflux MFS transporter [Alphaproteobacteria bacterium]
MTAAANTAPAPGARRGLMAVIIAATALGSLSLNIFLPSVPGLQRDFGAEYATVQLGLTLYLATLAVAQLFYGPLSDRFGRRPLLRAGLAIYVAGTVACLLAPDIWFFVAGRVVQAAGGCAGLVIGRAILRDLYKRERAAAMIAYVSMVMIVAPTFAPAIGGFLDSWIGWRGSFFFLLAFGTTTLIAALVALPETLVRKSRTLGVRGMIGEFRVLLGMRAFRGYAFQVGFITGAFYTFLGAAAHVTISLMHMSPFEYGLAYIAVSGGFMVGAFISTRFSERLGSDRMILIGLSFSAVGMFCLGLIELFAEVTPFALFATMTALAFGNGFSVPNGSAGAISVDPSRAGAASGLLGGLQMTVGTGLSFLVAALLTDSTAPMTAIMVLSAAAAWLVFLWGVRPLARSSRG